MYNHKIIPFPLIFIINESKGLAVPTSAVGSAKTAQITAMSNVGAQTANITDSVPAPSVVSPTAIQSPDITAATAQTTMPQTPISETLSAVASVDTSTIVPLAQEIVADVPQDTLAEQGTVIGAIGEAPQYEAVVPVAEPVVAVAAPEIQTNNVGAPLDLSTSIGQIPTDVAPTQIADVQALGASDLTSQAANQQSIIPETQTIDQGSIINNTPIATVETESKADININIIDQTRIMQGLETFRANFDASYATLKAIIDSEINLKINDALAAEKARLDEREKNLTAKEQVIMIGKDNLDRQAALLSGQAQIVNPATNVVPFPTNIPQNTAYPDGGQTPVQEPGQVLNLELSTQQRAA